MSNLYLTDTIKSLTKKELLIAFKNCFSYSRFFLFIYNSKNKTNIEYINHSKIHLQELQNICDKYNIDIKKQTQYFGKHSPIWQLSKKEFLTIVNNSNSIKDILSFFNLTNHGSNFKTLKQRFEFEKINYQKFLNEKAKERVYIKRDKKENPLISDSNSSRRIVKKILIRNNLMPYICAICKEPPIWNNKPLVLILDHINGINNDNRLENLRFVCPNCNSQLDTHAGRNINKTKYIPTKLDILHKINTSKSEQIIVKKDIDKKSIKEIKNKPTKPIKIKQPIYKNIIEVYLSTIKIGFVKTSKIYNVSDNAVRKWLKKHDLIIDKEWNTNYLKLYEYYNQYNKKPNDSSNELTIWLDNLIYLFNNKQLGENKIKLLKYISLNILDRII